MQATANFNVYYLSERAVTLEFGYVIDEQLLQQIQLFDSLLKQQPFAGLVTTVPAYTTLTVFYDPLEVSKAPGLHGIDCFEKVSNYLKGIETRPPHNSSGVANAISIPVCYGAEFGLDLEELALLHSISSTQLIELHTSATYKVYMIGFVPGFAYMGGLPDTLETPRKPTPRKAVPAGSVGIAGKQTGIYPLETPGGWQIIGRTPLQLFDANRQQPSLFKAGDEVIFKAIGLDEFNAIAG